MVGQHVPGQDLKVQAALHYLALVTSCPVGTLGMTIVFAAYGKCCNPCSPPPSGASFASNSASSRRALWWPQPPNSRGLVLLSNDMFPGLQLPPPHNTCRCCHICSSACSADSTLQAWPVGTGACSHTCHHLVTPSHDQTHDSPASDFRLLKLWVCSLMPTTYAYSDRHIHSQPFLTIHEIRTPLNFLKTMLSYFELLSRLESKGLTDNYDFRSSHY